MQAGNGYSRREATTGRAVGQGEGILGDPVKTWRGRRVFLTGHTGFKGSWLALWLSSLGAKIRGYALDPSTEPNMFTLACIGSVVEDVRGDVRDYAELQASITEFAPEVVFHLAAQPIVRRASGHPRHERHGYGSRAGGYSQDSERPRSMNNTVWPWLR